MDMTHNLDDLMLLHAQDILAVLQETSPIPTNTLVRQIPLTTAQTKELLESLEGQGLIEQTTQGWCRR